MQNYKIKEYVNQSLFEINGVEDQRLTVAKLILLQ
jgi:hypothetical protein